MDSRFFAPPPPDVDPCTGYPAYQTPYASSMNPYAVQPPPVILAPPPPPTVVVAPPPPAVYGSYTAPTLYHQHHGHHGGGGLIGEILHHAFGHRRY